MKDVVSKHRWYFLESKEKISGSDLLIVILKEIVHLDLLNRVGLRFEEYFQTKALETQDTKKR